MSGLKPCPFCGGKAEMNYTAGFFRARCQDETCYGYHSSGAESSDLVRYADLAMAVEKWNDRDGDFATENERLRAKIEELEYQIEDMQYEMMEMSER